MDAINPEMEEKIHESEPFPKGFKYVLIAGLIIVIVVDYLIVRIFI
jgi:hypothetical protein